MANFHLADYKALTGAQQLEYYNWLVGNSARIEELHDEKDAQCRLYWESAGEKTIRIQDNMEYSLELRSKVAAKMGEREAIQKFIAKISEITDDTENSLKLLDPQLERIHKFYNGIDEKVEENQELIETSYKKCFRKMKEKIRAARKVGREGLKDIKFIYEQRQQSLDATKNNLDEKCQILNDLYAIKDEHLQMLTELGFDEVKTENAEYMAEIDNRKKHIEEETNSLTKDQKELDEILGKYMALGKLDDELKTAIEIQWDKRNVADKDVQNENLLYQKTVANKFEEVFRKKLSNTNLEQTQKLHELMAKTDEIEKQNAELEEAEIADKKEIENLEAEYKEAQLRLKRFLSAIETYSNERIELKDLDKDKIEAAEAKIEKDSRINQDLKVKFLQEVATLTNNQLLFKQFEAYFDNEAMYNQDISINDTTDELELTEELELSEESEMAEKPQATQDSDSSSGSSGLPSNNASLCSLGGKSLKELVDSLDPVKSCEQLYKSKMKKD